MLVLHPPVPGPIVRPFAYHGSPFARGLHRGVDLAARPGAAVRAPCDGAVAYAGPQAVTLVCARRRVTMLPVTRVVVRAGAAIQTGAAVGRVRGTEGLHLGVRRAGDPFGYVDPAPLLARSRPAPPPFAGPRSGGRARRDPRGRPGRAPVAQPAPLPAPPPAPAPWPAPEPHLAPAPRTAPLGTAQPVAPWPAWAGLALALGGVRLRRRRRRSARIAAAPARAGPGRVP